MWLKTITVIKSYPAASHATKHVKFCELHMGRNKKLECSITVIKSYATASRATKHVKFRELHMGQNKKMFSKDESLEVFRMTVSHGPESTKKNKKTINVEDQDQVAEDLTRK